MSTNKSESNLLKKNVKIILAILLAALFVIIIKCLKDNNFPLTNSSNEVTVNNLNELTVGNLQDLFNSDIEKNTVLIFEPNPYHYECTPGYVKYFTDLGYNVDTVATKECQESLEILKPTKKIRIFNYDNLNEIYSNSEKLNSLFKNYKYVLVQTTDPSKKELYEKFHFCST